MKSKNLREPLLNWKICLLLSGILISEASLAVTHCYKNNPYKTDAIGWSCKYSMALNPLATKSATYLCDDGVRDKYQILAQATYSGKKGSTSCIQSQTAVSPFLVTCTNWKPIGSDGFDIYVHCPN